MSLPFMRLPGSSPPRRYENSPLASLVSFSRLEGKIPPQPWTYVSSLFGADRPQRRSEHWPCPSPQLPTMPILLGDGRLLDFVATDLIFWRLRNGAPAQRRPSL